MIHFLLNPPKTAVVRLGLVAVLGSFFLFSQTSPSTKQLRGESGDFILVTDSNGRLVVAELGPGVSIDRTTARPRLLVNTTSVTFVLNEPVKFTNKTYIAKNLPVTGSTALYRNGVRQALAVDYTVAGNTLSFFLEPLPDDLFLLDYLKAN